MSAVNETTLLIPRKVAQVLVAVLGLTALCTCRGHLPRCRLPNSREHEALEACSALYRGYLTFLVETQPYGHRCARLLRLISQENSENLHCASLPNNASQGSF